MDHKTLTIAPVSLAVILLLGANIGLISSVSGKQIRGPQGPPGPADPTNFGPNCVGCITTQNIANGAITHSKIALHSIDKTQLTFTIHNGTNGAQGPIGQTGATDHKAYKVSKDQQDHRVQGVSMAPMAYKEYKDHKDQLDKQVLQDQQDHKDQQDLVSSMDT